MDFAILETNGSLSVIPKTRKVKTLLPDALISDGCINQEALQNFKIKDEAWLKK